MITTDLNVFDLVIGSVAWLILATFLVLDRLGRLPFRQRRNPRVYRLQNSAGLALITGMVVTEIGELSDWPLPVRTAIHLADVPLAIGCLVCFLLALSWYRADARNRQQGEREPGNVRSA